MKTKLQLSILSFAFINLSVATLVHADGIRSGRKTKAESTSLAESCPETVTSGGHSTITVKPGEFGFLCFKMEVFDPRGEIVESGIPTRPGGMADAAVSEAMDKAAAKCESGALILDDFDKPAESTFTCKRRFPAGWAMGGNLVGAIQESHGEITEEEREAQDKATGVGPLRIKLVTQYVCSAKVEAYCR